MSLAQKDGFVAKEMQQDQVGLLHDSLAMLTAETINPVTLTTRTPKRVGQACPKSGLWAKSGPWQNFVRPAAWFKFMKRIRPVAPGCLKKMYSLFFSNLARGMLYKRE